MDPVEVLRRQGGLATASTLVGVCGRTAVVAAVRSGLVVRTGRGRFALPQLDAGLRAAHGLTGVLSHASAAAWWGWEARDVPTVATVTVPWKRKRLERPGVDLRQRDLPPTDVVAPGVTSPLRTVLDCASTLPFAAAVAIADSALRHGHVDPTELLLAAQASPARGHARRVRVAEEADGRAANPFESCLRCLARAAGLDVVPQVWIHTPHGWVRPDLLDDRRGIAVEAESFTWHGQRTQLTRDCVKYNDLSLAGLRLLRFSWEQVFLDEPYVDAVLTRARTGVVRWTGARATRPADQRRSA